MNERWRGWQNAEHYQRFVHEHSVYDWLNRELVERAELGTARRVLDLGCGTGATTRAALALMPADAEVLGVDGSEEMIEVGRANTLDPRARFVVHAADELASAPHIVGPFDRILSNAALFQFPDLPGVLDACAALLAPAGLFVFDVPSQRQPDAGGSHPLQVALARELEQRAGVPFTPMAPPFDPDRFKADAEARGFEELSRQERTYRASQGELAELMSIPAMLTPLATEIGEVAAREALTAALARIDPSEEVGVPWVFFVFRRRG